MWSFRIRGRGSAPFSETLSTLRSAMSVFMSPEIMTDDHSMMSPQCRMVASQRRRRLLAIGNPLVAAGEFYSAFTRNARGWQTFSIGWRHTPNSVDIESIDDLLAIEPSELERD